MKLEIVHPAGAVYGAALQIFLVRAVLPYPMRYTLGSGCGARHRSTLARRNPR
jgi:hypothetical protein